MAGSGVEERCFVRGARAVRRGPDDGISRGWLAVFLFLTLTFGSWQQAWAQPATQTPGAPGGETGQAGTVAPEKADLARTCRSLIAMARQDRRTIGDAVLQCQDAVKSAPDDIDLTFEYGQLLSDALVFDELAAIQFRKAAEQGHAGAQNALGIALINGRGVPQNLKEGVRWTREAAENGLADAQNNLGSLYAAGIGVPADMEKAVFWMSQAAEQGDRQAQYNLGEAYATGEGVDQDWDQARSWYEKAAANGETRAGFRLWRIYSEGRGLDADIPTSLTWLRKAAEGGHAEAQVTLGNHYRAGRGVAEDPVEATNWYRAAARQGFPPGEFLFGLSLARDRNFDESRTWMKRAADDGHPDAQFMMGIFHHDGLGALEPDPSAAADWYRKAAASGHKDAIAALQELESSEASGATPTQEGQAQ